MVLLVVAAVGLLALFSFLVVALRRRSRRLQARAVVLFNGEPATLDVVVWSIAVATGETGLRRAISGKPISSAADVSAHLERYIDSLSEADRRAVEERIKLGQRAQAERALWDVQNESLTTAASVGMIDSVILAAGADPEWSVGLVEQALANTDVSQFLIESVLGQVGHHYFELFHRELFEQVVGGVDQVAGAAIDTGVNAAIDGTGLGLGAIADAHIPVVTVVRSLYQASRSSQAGLDSDRVAENLGWDVVAKGGGIVAGAAIGTAIFPGVGTVIGGFLGGLFGSEAAEQGKTRHLRAAVDRADESNARVGESISPDSWREIASTMAEHLGWLQTTQQDLGRAAISLKQGFVPPLMYYLVARASRVGAIEVQRVSDEYTSWLAELSEYDAPEFAYARGVLLLTRPELHERLGVKPKLVAKAMTRNGEVQEERRNLELAQGN